MFSEEPSRRGIWPPTPPGDREPLAGRGPCSQPCSQMHRNRSLIRTLPSALSAGLGQHQSLAPPKKMPRGRLGQHRGKTLVSGESRVSVSRLRVRSLKASMCDCGQLGLTNRAVSAPLSVQRLLNRPFDKLIKIRTCEEVACLGGGPRTGSAWCRLLHHCSRVRQTRLANLHMDCRGSGHALASLDL